MGLPEIISNTRPLQFIAEDLKSDRAKERFIKRSTKVQVAKIITFFLGHNSDCFAAEPVYGPTGQASLKSRGVQGLEKDNHILHYLNSPEGLRFIESFRNKVIHSIKETA